MNKREAINSGFYRRNPGPCADPECHRLTTQKYCHACAVREYQLEQSRSLSQAEQDQDRIYNERRHEIEQEIA